ncbi:ATP-binding protein [Streptomyces parvulus]|uniref:ATP-binding protein n=1 Tax=Streptomyces parvulus TaxID=146923 RepID=UPI001E36789B|nr:ATP-binding protein [Streptomyces parvulus]MCC9153823.1 ATP-binding protein [Streptomyces parvulus]MCE7687244.1 ATP-binding protein [Streptomyces parvulus]
MTSAPPLRRGTAVVMDGGCRADPAQDAMSICFEVSPCRSRHSIAGDDARRVQMTRRATAARLNDWGLTALVDDAVLMVSELVTHAIQHSATDEITLVVSVREDSLHIRVSDGTPVRAQLRRADDDAESGRGLWLVEALVVERGGSWGTSDTGEETWCCLPVAAEQPW